MNFKRILSVCILTICLFNTVIANCSNFDNWCSTVGQFYDTGVTVFYVDEWENNNLQGEYNTEINENRNQVTTNTIINQTTNSIANKTTNSLSISPSLSVTSNIKLNGVSVGENGMRIVDNANVICNLGVTNSSTRDDSATVILSTYTNEGNLHAIRTYKINVAAGQTNSVEIAYQFDADTEYSGKLIILNTFANMIPIRASIDFTQTSGVNAYYYNSDNRLLQIDKTNGKSLIYTYDNMGNLLSKMIRE